MKLKEFNTENSISSRTTSPAVGVNSKAGVFTFNQPAADLLGLQVGDRVVLLQDLDESENWYVEKLSGKDSGRGFALRGKNEKYGLSFSSTTLAREIFESVGYREDSGRALIAGQATMVGKRALYGILTNSLKTTRKAADDADN